MTAQRWLPTVLRARQAQEDVVAAQVAAARRDAEQAAGQLAAHHERLAGWESPTSGSVSEFHAETHSQQAAAATLAAAASRVRLAELRVAGQLSALTEAARSRRTVEKLAERLHESATAHAGAIAQREQDEVAITRHRARREQAG